MFQLHRKTDVKWLLSLLFLAHWRWSSTGEHLSSQLQFLIQTRSSLLLLPVACYKYFSSYPWAFFFSLFKATSPSCLQASNMSPRVKSRFSARRKAQEMLPLLFSGSKTHTLLHEHHPQHPAPQHDPCLCGT